MRRTLAGFLIMAVLSALGAVGGEIEPASGTWPGWRGPTRSGIVEGKTPWPSKLDGTRLTLMWRQELGEGYPGQVVSTARVFTVETRSREREIVRAFDRFSGKQIWEHSWEGSMKVPFFSARNGSWVRSTPAYDDGYLYVAGMRDVLFCLKADDGTELWRVDFVKQFGNAKKSITVRSIIKQMKMMAAATGENFRRAGFTGEVSAILFNGTPQSTT